MDRSECRVLSAGMNPSNEPNEANVLNAKKISLVKQEDTGEVSLDMDITTANILSAPSVARMDRTSPTVDTRPTDDTHSKIDPDNLLEVPDGKANHSSFPPGCIVLRVDSTSFAQPTVTLGTVDAVFVDLIYSSQRGTFVYRFVPSPPFHEQGPVLIRESGLHLGPSCPVWARPVHLTLQEDEVSATVLGSYVLPEGIFYSVLDATNNAQYDGIPSSSIVVRSGPKQTSKIRERVPSLANPPHRGAEGCQDNTSNVSSTSSEQSPRPMKKKRMSGENVALKQSSRSVGEQTPMWLVGELSASRGSIEERWKPPPTPTPATALPSAISKSPTQSKRKRESTRELIIPIMVHSNVLKNTIISQSGHHSLWASLRCSIKLRGYPFEPNADRRRGSRVVLTGRSDNDISFAENRVEDMLLEVIDERLRGKFLHYFAKQNSLGITEGKAVYYRSSKEMESKVWTAIVHVGRKNEYDTYIARFLGKGKARFKALYVDCGCSVTRVEVDGVCPYFFISGDSSAVVNKAHKLVKRSWEAVKGAKARRDSF